MLTVAEPVIAAPDDHPHRRTHDGLIGAAVAVVPVALSITLAVLGHAWGIARTDDWAFARVAFGLHRTGHLQLVGWSQMNLVGLVGWAQPFLWIFGDHVWVLDLSVAVLMAAGLAAAYRVARGFLPPGRAGLAVIAVAVFPGFLRDMSTYMTDAPAFAIQAIVLAFGIEAISARGRRRGVFLGCVVILGFWGFSVREFAIAAPLAVLAAVYLGAERQRRRGIVVVVVGFLAACGALYLWRAGLPGAQQLNGRPGTTVAVVIFIRVACTTGLGLVPALAWTAPSWWHPVSLRARRLGCAVGACAAFLAVTLSHSAQHLLGGDYLDPRGVNGANDMLGSRPTLLPEPVWAGLTLLAVVALVVTAGLVAEWVVTRPPRSDIRARMLALHVAAVAGSCGVAAFLNGQLFDRYLWPVVLSGSILILSRYGLIVRRRNPIGVAPLVAAGLLAVALAANSAAFDGARWHAAEALTRQGLAPQAIDAGFEWAGAHATALTTPTRTLATVGTLSWWLGWFPHPEICAVVTSSPVSIPGYVPAGTQPWNLVLGAVPERLSVYRSASPTCRAGR